MAKKKTLLSTKKGRIPALSQSCGISPEDLPTPGIHDVENPLRKKREFFIGETDWETHICIYIKTQNPLFSAQEDRICQIKVSMTRRFFRTSQKVPPEPSAKPGRNWDSRLITDSKYPPRKPAKPGDLKTQVLE